MGKKEFGIACLAGAAVFAYVMNQRGYFNVPQDKIDEVSAKKAKEIRLSYDEMLKHNIDSLIDTGLPVKKAVKDAHTITWEEAERTMPKQCKDYSNEDWVKLDEAQTQLEKSRKVIPGRATMIVYHEEYPEQLAEQIQKQKKELRIMNSKEQTNSTNSRKSAGMEI